MIRVTVAAGFRSLYPAWEGKNHDEGKLNNSSGSLKFGALGAPKLPLPRINKSLTWFEGSGVMSRLQVKGATSTIRMSAVELWGDMLEVLRRRASLSVRMAFDFAVPRAAVDFNVCVRVRKSMHLVGHGLWMVLRKKNPRSAEPPRPSSANRHKSQGYNSGSFAWQQP